MPEFYLSAKGVRKVQKTVGRTDHMVLGTRGQRRPRRPPSIPQKSGLTFQLIRGSVVEVITRVVDLVTYRYLTVTGFDGVIPFEENAKKPTEDPVNVAFPSTDTAPSPGDIVWAAYHKEIVTIPADEYDGPVVIDWYKLPTGTGTNVPPLRRFELTTGKFSTTTSVFAKFLDFDGNEVGVSEVLHDPEQMFAGQPANFLGEYFPSRGFRGIALLRQDLGEYEFPDRWEIVDMESWTPWVTAVYEAGDEYSEDPRKQVNWFRYTGISKLTDHGDRVEPTMVDEPLRWDNLVSNKLVNPQVGDVVLLMLEDADGFPSTPPDGWDVQPWAPLYLPVAAQGGSSSPPMRRFFLTEGKYSTDPYVTGTFLTDAGIPVGDEVIFYDPHFMFAGRAADYLGEYGDEGPFTGVALLRTDLGETQPDRWEIVEMEGFARWITATYEAALGEVDTDDVRKQINWFRFTGIYPTADGYYRRVPYPVDEPVRWDNGVSDALVEPHIGDVVLMMLENSDGFSGSPDTGWEIQPWAPLYVPVSKKQTTGPGGGAPFTCRVYEQIDPGASDSPETGDGDVWHIGADASVNALPSGNILLNPFPLAAIGDTTCMYLGPVPDDEEMRTLPKNNLRRRAREQILARPVKLTVSSIRARQFSGLFDTEPPGVYLLMAPTLKACGANVVTDVTCNEYDEIEVTVETIVFVHPTCEPDVGA